MLINCRCGQTNRLPSDPRKRAKCGKCGHLFMPRELAKARVEPPPDAIKSDMAAIFGAKDLLEATHECTDADDCGWEGSQDELEDGRCPDCGKRVRKLV